MSVVTLRSDFCRRRRASSWSRSARCSASRACSTSTPAPASSLAPTRTYACSPALFLRVVLAVWVCLLFLLFLFVLIAVMLSCCLALLLRRTLSDRTPNNASFLLPFHALSLTLDMRSVPFAFPRGSCVRGGKQSEWDETRLKMRNILLLVNKPQLPLRQLPNINVVPCPPPPALLAPDPAACDGAAASTPRGLTHSTPAVLLMLSLLLFVCSGTLALPPLGRVFE